MRAIPVEWYVGVVARGLEWCRRPRDITEEVLSQMGTLLVHRLTNDRDREVVERASGELDHSAAAR